jgi:hypothetical protein
VLPFVWGWWMLRAAWRWSWWAEDEVQYRPARLLFHILASIAKGVMRVAVPQGRIQAIEHLL